MKSLRSSLEGFFFKSITVVTEEKGMEEKDSGVKKTETETWEDG